LIPRAVVRAIEDRGEQTTDAGLCTIHALPLAPPSRTHGQRGTSPASAFSSAHGQLHAQRKAQHFPGGVGLMPSSNNHP